jgi:hypothetical protein
MKNCGNCTKEFEENYKFCPYCGSREDGNKNCPSCGAKVKKDYPFCFNCGYKFNINQQTKKLNIKETIIMPESEKVQENIEEFYSSAQTETVKKPKKEKKCFIKGFNKEILNYVFRCASLALSVAIFFVLLFAPIYTYKMDLTLLRSYTTDNKTEINLNISFIDIVSANLKSLTYDEKDWKKYLRDSEISDAIIEFQNYITEVTRTSQYSIRNIEIDMDIIESIFSKINLADLEIMNDIYLEYNNITIEYNNITISGYQFIFLSLCILAILILDLIFLILTLIKVIKFDKSPLKFKLIINMLLMTISTIFIFNLPIESGNFSQIKYSGPNIASGLIIPLVFSILILGMAYTEKILSRKTKFCLKNIILSSATAVLAFIIGISSLGGIINLKGETENYNVKATLNASNVVDILDVTQKYIAKFNNDSSIVQAYPNLEDVYNIIKTQTDSADLRSERQSYFNNNIFEIFNAFEIINNNVAMVILIIISSIFGYASAIMMIFAIKYILNNFFEENNKNIKKGLIFTSISTVIMLTVILITSIFCVSMNQGIMQKEMLNIKFYLAANPIIITLILSANITLFIIYLLSNKTNPDTMINNQQNQMNFEQYQQILNATTINTQKTGYFEQNETLKQKSFIEQDNNIIKQKSFIEQDDSIITQNSFIEQDENIKKKSDSIEQNKVVSEPEKEKTSSKKETLAKEDTTKTDL